MKENSSKVIAVVLTCGLGFLLYWLWFTLFERYEEKIIEKKQEYFTQRFYAAERLLAMRNIGFNSNFKKTSLNNKQNTNSVLFLNMPAKNLSALQLSILIDFISHGGHLIYAPNLNRDNYTPEQDKLLRFFNIQVQWQVPDTITSNDKSELQQNYHINDENIELVLRSNFAFESADSAHLQALKTFTYSDGYITVINDAGLWLNNRIGDGDHALLLLQLVIGFDALNVIWAPYSPSLMVAFFEHYIDFIVLFMITLFLWVHYKSRRSYRIDTQLLSSRRSMQEHISAYAWLLWRSKNRGKMVAFLLDDIEQRMIKQSAGFLNAPKKIKCQMLAKRSGFSEQVVMAWYQPDELKSTDFVATVSQLQQIRKAL